MSPPPSNPSAGQIYDESMVMVTGLVAGAAIMPGFFLCVPGLVLVLGPLIVLGLLAALVGLVITLVVASLLLVSRVARRFQRVFATRRTRPASSMSVARQ